MLTKLASDLMSYLLSFPDDHGYKEHQPRQRYRMGCTATLFFEGHGVIEVESVRVVRRRHNHALGERAVAVFTWNPVSKQTSSVAHQGITMAWFG